MEISDKISISLFSGLCWTETPICNWGTSKRRFTQKWLTSKWVSSTPGLNKNILRKTSTTHRSKCLPVSTAWEWGHITRRVRSGTAAPFVVIYLEPGSWSKGVGPVTAFFLRHTGPLPSHTCSWRAPAGHERWLKKNLKSPGFASF
ncbi:unnamed protein product, partial [Ectocarpus fasciculatus]